jgi:signal transduction histidine kinase
MLRARIAAEQASREKSEFIANMSHELRTPLNSLLILAKLLADNAAGNLTDRQVKFAQTIHDSGMDLLALINDVLDPGAHRVRRRRQRADRPARAERAHRVHRERVSPGRRLQRTALRSPARGGRAAAIDTDSQRLQQIVRNLLSNAFKFTRHGGVTFEIALASSGWTPGHAQLDARTRRFHSR